MIAVLTYSRYINYSQASKHYYIRNNNKNTITFYKR